MFTALSDESLDIKSSLHKFVALSPCVIFETKEEDEKLFESGLYKFPSMGIHAFKGPNWEDDLKKICDELSPDICEEWTNRSNEERAPGVFNQPTSMRNVIYWWNNGF